MIPYSVFMMKNPMKAEEPAKAYANGQVREKLSTDKFVAHVASRIAQAAVLKAEKNNVTSVELKKK